MRSLDDKVVLVTGGGSGLGAAICRNLGKANMRIAVGDLRPDAAAATAAAVIDARGRAFALHFDVGDEAAAVAAVDDTVEHFGGLDVLVNNAGTDVTAPIDEVSIADWDRVMNTNLRGPFILSRAAVAAMADRGGGHIVNVASTASRRAWPNAALYHASKWGLMGLSHALHAELREKNIRVSALIAGGMRTPFLLDRFEGLDPTRLQDPADVAEVVRFVLAMPGDSIIPEVMVLPRLESSWP
jgi:NAD(P)-dependent dehydrogenase (short-subunit alcohol dehydrogenase family)